MDRTRYENMILELVNEGMAMEAIRDLAVFQVGNYAETKSKLAECKATIKLVRNLCNNDTTYRNRIETIKGVLDSGD